MKNVLIDQNCKWLVNEDSKKYLENYDQIFVVGVHLKQRDYDETLATFCKDNECAVIQNWLCWKCVKIALFGER